MQFFITLFRLHTYLRVGILFTKSYLLTVRSDITFPFWSRIINVALVLPFMLIISIIRVILSAPVKLMTSCYGRKSGPVNFPVYFVFDIEFTIGSIRWMLFLNNFEFI